MKKRDYPTEVLDVEVTDLNDQGFGIAVHRHPPKHEGSEGKKLTLFLPDTIPGDKVRVSVPNAKGRKRATLDYETLLEPSPDRVGERLAGQAKDGSSPLRYMSYEAQLAYKEAKVKGYLEDQGFDPDLVRPILGMEDPFHYRNKMELTFGKNGALGMHQAGNYLEVVDWTETLLAPEFMLEVKEEVSAWQEAHQLPSYDKETHQGLLRHLMIRYSHTTDEVMVALFTTADPEDYEVEATDLARRLAGRFENLEALTWIKNTDPADRTGAERVVVLHGRDYIYDDLYGFTYRLWFDTFFQPNPLQAEKMVDIALDLSQVDQTQRTLDLFCGVGTFSLPFAERSKELAGIEIVESSIESAIRNAEENGIDNTIFMARDARKGMAELEETWGQPDLVLLDPPRSGAGGKVMRRIGRLGTDRIVYVSCNPKSLAEDLTWLRDFGYELQVVQPVDQFPHTVHVECVVLIEKVE